MANSLVDSFYGGRWVARHNYMVNMIPSGHGTESGAGRGQRANEFYDNTINMTVEWSGGGQRSGTSLWHDNTFLGHNSDNGSACNLSNFRETPARGIQPSGTFTVADGTCPWDQNDTEENGTGRTLDAIYAQIINGQPIPRNPRCTCALWPRSQLEPCYSWNNVYTPTNHVLGFGGGGQPTTKPGVDYFNLGGGFPADSTPSQVFSTYNAARNGVYYAGTFIYPHPLVSAQPSPSPTPAPAPAPSSMCSQLQQRLDRLQSRQRHLQQRHRRNQRLNRKIRRLQNQLQVHNCP